MAKQTESVLQRTIVQALRKGGRGYYWRVRNGATFDPTRGIFRSNTAEKGIPDICGYREDGKSVFIECKYLEKVENRKKLTFKVKISEEQKEFLYRAYKSGCLAGVAYNLEDAIAIVENDYERYPRHPRTFCFLSDSERELYEVEYRKRKAAHAALNNDPLQRILWASGPKSQ